MNLDVAQIISAVVSGIFGAGFASWVVKQAIGRSLTKIDQLEASVNNLNMLIARMGDKIGDLFDFKKEHKTLESNVAELRHYVKECDENHKDNKEAFKVYGKELCSVREHLNNLERQVDRISNSKAK